MVKIKFPKIPNPFKKKYVAPPPKYYTPAPSGRQSVPPEFGGVQTNLPASDIPIRSGGGSGGGSAQQQLQVALQQQGFTKPQATSLVRREMIARIAQQRRKGFTQRQAIQLLGGGQGVRALREARRLGGSSAGVRNLYQEIVDGSKKGKNGEVQEVAIDSRTGRPLGFVESYKRPKQGVVSEFKIPFTKVSVADIQSFLRDEKFKGRYSKGTKAEIRKTGVAVLSVVADTAGALVDLPETGYRVLKNPKLLLQIPKIVDQEGKNFGYIARTNPSEAIGYVGGNLISIYGSSKAINLASDLSKTQLTKLSTKYVGKLKTGDVVKIPVGGGKSVTIKVVGSIPKSTIKKQLSLAGKEIPVAISSQQQKLVGLIRRGRVIRKPIPGEEGFNLATRKLLRRLDRGVIKRNELIRLEKLVRKQGGKGVLERSFFASPGGEVRPSRLGILDDGKAKFSDYLTEDITFRQPKPQVLVFRNVKVQNFPKNLRGIVKKIRAGKKLTQKESGKLLAYQFKQSGKFKPLGFISGEKEITLAPGEIVRRKKLIGRALIKNKPVAIVEAEVVRPTGALKKLIKKAERGSITPKELRKLNKSLKKKTGFDYNLSSRTTARRFVNVRGSGVSLSSKVLKRYSYKGKFISSSKYSGLSSKAKSNVSIVRYSPRGSPGSPIRPSPRGSPPFSPIRYPPKYPPGKVGKPPFIPKKFRFDRGRKPTKKLSKAIQTYNVFGKSGRKFVKLNRGVLSLRDALNKGSYAIDNTTAKTFKIVGAGKRKRIFGVSGVEKNYYKKASFKLREFRIKRGRKFTIVPKYIEKRKFGIDTRGEKRGLSLSRYLKARGLKTKNIIRSPKPRRRISSSQRKVMLRNLVKARRVLARRRR